MRTAHLQKSSPETGSIVLPFLFFSCLLLAALKVDVVVLMPPQMAERQRNWIPEHQELKNFFLAERLISKQVPAPVTLWSGINKCREIGHGIWFAEGTVEIESPPGQEMLLVWKAIFIPATSQSLYLQVGSRKDGDFNGALQRAGIRPENL